jgi:EAL domain-containing protein (putative c-di-GMP-specific phosphodiesterase class I)
MITPGTSPRRMVGTPGPDRTRWPRLSSLPEPGVDIPTSAWDDLLDHVLIHQDVEVFWQPILDLRGPSVVGYEGFARFAGATGLSPDRWFSEAATRGRRSELEALALRAALRRLGDAPRNCFLSLNLSPHALIDDNVQRALFDVPDLSGVVIELTAPTHPEDIDELARRAGPLRRAGAALALTYTVDDTTHEELLFLRPRVLKIAEPIVAEIRRANHDRDRETSEALSRLAGSFGGRIVVQNVERMQDLVALRDVGIRFVQGFLVGVPTTSWRPLASEIGTTNVA